MKVTTKTTKMDIGFFNKLIEEVKVAKEFKISEVEDSIEIGRHVLQVKFLTRQARAYLETRVSNPKTGEMYSMESENLEEAKGKMDFIFDRAEREGTPKEDLTIRFIDKHEAFTVEAEVYNAEIGSILIVPASDMVGLEVRLVSELEERFTENGTLTDSERTAIHNLFNQTPPEGGGKVGPESESIEHMTQEEYDQYLDSVVKQDAPLERSYDGIVDFESLSSDFLPDFEEIEASILGSYDHPEAAIIDEVDEDELDRVHLINFYDDRHFIELLTDRDGAYILKAEAGDEVTLYKTYSPISASRKAQGLTVEYFYYIAERIEHHEEDRSRALDIIQDLKTRLLEEGVGLDGAFDKMFKIELGKLLIAC